MAQAMRPSFGIMTAPMQVEYGDVLRVWREADAIPEIEHAWVFDHSVRSLGEACTVIRRLWTETEPFDFAGAHFQLTGAFCNPKPVHRRRITVHASPRLRTE